MGRKPSAEWSSITDQAERRRAQNRLAQRKKRQRETENTGPSSSVVVASSAKTVRSIDSATERVENSDIFQASSGISADVDKLESPTFLYSPDQLVLEGLDTALSRNQSLPASAGFVRSHDENPSAAGPSSQIPSASASPNFHWSTTSDFDGNWEATSQRHGHQLSPPGSRPAPAPSQQAGRPEGYRSFHLIPDRTLKRKSSSFTFGRGSREATQGFLGRQVLSKNAETSPYHESLESRISEMISTARSLGFDSLDSMMLQYYTEIVEENPSLLEMQSRSRRRELPAMLSQLSKAAKTWPQREAQGFEEALLASVEHVVQREAESYAQARANEASLKHAAPADTAPLSVKSLRVDLPNTWTILYETANSFLPSEEESSEFVREAMARLVTKE